MGKKLPDRFGDINKFCFGKEGVLRMILIIYNFLNRKRGIWKTNILQLNQQVSFLPFYRILHNHNCLITQNFIGSNLLRTNSFIKKRLRLNMILYDCFICDALCDLVTFTQFQKCEKHP